MIMINSFFIYKLQYFSYKILQYLICNNSITLINYSLIIWVRIYNISRNKSIMIRYILIIYEYYMISWSFSRNWFRNFIFIIIQSIIHMKSLNKYIFHSFYKKLHFILNSRELSLMIYNWIIKRISFIFSLFWIRNKVFLIVLPLFIHPQPPLYTSKKQT